MTPQPVWTIVPPVHGDEAMVIAPDGGISFMSPWSMLKLIFRVTWAGGRMEVRE